MNKVTPPPAHNGLYQILLAMKYLRSSDEEWTVFVDDFDKLLKYWCNQSYSDESSDRLEGASECINAVELHKIVKQT